MLSYKTFSKVLVSSYRVDLFDMLTERFVKLKHKTNLVFYAHAIITFPVRIIA